MQRAWEWDGGGGDSGGWDMGWAMGWFGFSGVVMIWCGSGDGVERRSAVLQRTDWAVSIGLLSSEP